jgi:hypothetical protein
MMTVVPILFSHLAALIEIEQLWMIPKSLLHESNIPWLSGFALNMLRCEPGGILLLTISEAFEIT